jgi:hypothetical protein
MNFGPRPRNHNNQQFNPLEDSLHHRRDRQDQPTDLAPGSLLDRQVPGLPGQIAFDGHFVLPAGRVVGLYVTDFDG